MRQDGSSTVEFTLVSTLLVSLFLLVLQVGFVLHTRTVLVASAQEVVRDGVLTMEVTVRGPLPLVFVPAGPMRITVQGHALEERR